MFSRMHYDKNPLALPGLFDLIEKKSCRFAGILPVKRRGLVRENGPS